jgi:hypothetical protein
MQRLSVVASLCTGRRIRRPAHLAHLVGRYYGHAGPGGGSIRAYYVKRFASGARGHAIKVLEVHVQGDGGYGINQFSVTVPGPNGALHEEHGTIVTAYRHEPDGWHLSLVAPSVPEMPGKGGS